jgi:hypothetical protein
MLAGVNLNVMALSGHSNCARVCPLLDAGSTGRCNTGVKSLCRGFELQGLPRPFIELTRHLIQISLRVHRQVGSLGKVLSQQTVGVLIGTALPRTLRIAEVNVDVGRQRKSSMIRKLLAPVSGQRLIQLTRQHFRLLDERGNNRLGVLIATIGVLCGGFVESSLRQVGCVEIYPGPAALFARFS